MNEIATAEGLLRAGHFEEALAEIIRGLARIFGLAEAPEALLRGLLHAVATAPVANWQGYYPVFERFGLLLAKSRATPESAWIVTVVACPIEKSSDAEFPHRFLTALALLGVSRCSSQEGNLAVFVR